MTDELGTKAGIAQPIEAPLPALPVATVLAIPITATPSQGNAYASRALFVSWVASIFLHVLCFSSMFLSIAARYEPPTSNTFIPDIALQQRADPLQDRHLPQVQLEQHRATSPLPSYTPPSNPKPVALVPDSPLQMGPGEGTDENRPLKLISPQGILESTRGRNEVSEQTTSHPPAPAAGTGYPEFFGVIGGDAKRIVYVVDMSGSMTNTFSMVRDELKRSIGNLPRDARFLILFFSHSARVMPPGKLLRANDYNKTKANNFINQTIPGGGTDPDSSLRGALATNPDVIYLLTDGMFDRKIEVKLNAWNGKRRSRINTICFMHNVAESLLMRIASDHGGAYKFVSPDEVAQRGVTGPLGVLKNASIPDLN